MNRFRLSVAVLVAFVLVAGCQGSGGPSGSVVSASPAAESESPSAVASTTPTLAPAELTLQVDAFEGGVTQEVWKKWTDRFTALHPGVNVKILIPPAAGERDNYAATLLTTGNFPDVAWPLAQTKFKDELLPFDQSDPEVQQMLNIDRVLIDGKLLGLGADAQPWNTNFYNKDLFASAGITEAPKTWDEFEAALAKLKAAGIVPMVGMGEWVPAFQFMSLNDIFPMTACWYGKRAAGEVRFTDPEWVEAATRFKGWVDAGYFGEAPLGTPYANGSEKFVRGEAAILPIGSWITPQINDAAFEVGYFSTPNRDGDLKLAGSIGSTGYTVSRTTKSPEAAVALAKYLAFDKEVITETFALAAFLPNYSLIEGNPPLEFSPLQEALASDIQNATSFNTAWNGQGDCAAVPGIDSQIGALLAEPLLLGEGDIPTMLKSLDTFWDEGAN